MQQQPSSLCRGPRLQPCLPPDRGLLKVPSPKIYWPTANNSTIRNLSDWNLCWLMRFLLDTNAVTALFNNGSTRLNQRV